MSLDEKVDALLKVISALSALVTAGGLVALRVLRAVRKLEVTVALMRRVAAEEVERHVVERHAVGVPQLSTKGGV